MPSKLTNSQLVFKITSFIVKMLLNIIFYVVVIVLIMEISKKTYDFCYQIFGQETASEEPGHDIEIQIKKGESTMNVASKLELNRIIVNKYSFYMKAKLKKHTIMPGTYIVNTSMTYDEIFTIITVPAKGDTDLSEGSNDADITKGADDTSATDDTNATEDANGTDGANGVDDTITTGDE